jgi:hypothetical protein
MQFVNEVFLLFNPHNSSLYSFQQLTTKDIFNTVCKHTDYFQKKKLKGFTTWCSQKNMHFFKAESSRKRIKSSEGFVYERQRGLYVVKEEYLGKI